MPYKRKDSPFWWASYTDQSGKRIRQATGTTDRKEAAALEYKWKLETYRLQKWDEQPLRKFEDVALVYLQEKSKKRSIKDLKIHVRRLRTHFEGFTMNTLRPKDVSEYIGIRLAEGVANSTVNRELEVLSASINLANQQLEWDLPNPVKGRKLKEPEGRLRWLSVTEAEQLLDTANRPASRYLVDFINIALHTGMRKGEILGLEWSRVNFHDSLMYLEGHHTKSAKRRAIPINKVAREALLRRMRYRAEVCPDSPWVFCNDKGERIQDVKRSFNTACRKAGIEDFRIHDLRHTCAAWLASSGVPLSEVRDLLGHSSITVTERYAHLAPENVRAAVSKLEDIESRFGHVENDHDYDSITKLLN